MAKARRGRTRVRRAEAPEAGGGGREHWRSDGAPKARFRSSDEANRAALQARLERGVDLDPYRCGICGEWHLGSRRG